jgi:outer membrane protein OmpA-like peptidoglycan-associated protein
LGVCAVGAAAILAGCRTPGELIVLAPNPEDGSVGQATVRAGGQSVELTREGEGTRVSPGEAPSTPETIPADELEEVFGAALEAQPLPAESFLLYFELGSDTLTPESAALLTRIVTAARERASVEVSIIGHTDTTGDAESNHALGLSRARLVLGILADAGVDRSVIELRSHGEADPLVPTEDDVAEARNRRVEVTIR